MFHLFKKDKKDFDYFESFHVISLAIVKLADLFVEVVENEKITSDGELFGEIEEIKESASLLKDELLDALYKDFLPPIERKDLFVLTYGLDRVLKGTADLLIHLDIYSVKINQGLIEELAEILVKITEKLPHLMEGLKDFKHPKKIKKTLEEVNEITNQGVKLYQEKIKNLYLKELVLIEIIKYTKIYDTFYEVFQAIDKLVHLVEAVIIENG